VVAGLEKGHGPLHSDLVSSVIYVGSLQLARHGRIAIVSVPHYPGGLLAVDLVSGDSVLSST